MTLDEIKEYVDICKPLDKAGAYGIQDNLIVEKYKGSLSNIIGLPLEELKEKIKEYGVKNGNNWSFYWLR